MMGYARAEGPLSAVSVMPADDVRPLPREQHGAEAHLLFDRHHDGERGLADVLRAGEEHLTGRRPHGERAADPPVRGDPQ